METGNHIRRPEPFRLPKGFAIALLPIAGYGLAFAYDLGWCQLFGIPVQLIKLDLTTGFVAGLALLTVFGLAPIPLWFVVFKGIGDATYAQAQIVIAILASVTVFAGVWLEPLTGFAVISCCLTAFVFYLNKVDRRLANSPNLPRPQEGHPWLTVMDYLGRERVTLLYLFTLTILAVYNFGYYTASNEREFLASRSSYVFLAQFGDEVIFGKVTERPRNSVHRFTLERQLVIKRVPEDGGLVLTPVSFEDLGRYNERRGWLSDLFK